jgi:predicted dehydrogenase
MTPIIGRPVRWGIAGPGRIAAKVAQDFVHVDDAELVAVASRSSGRAEAFAERHGLDRAYGSYLDLIGDDQIDAIYIATPHPQHRDIAVAALEAGQAVLVEKTFTASLAGAQQIVDTARARGVFAMEAMWTRFQPAVLRMRELVADGAIGDVLSVQADLGVTPDFDPADRLFNRDLAGGALLDLGVYPVSFAQMLLGPPQRVSAAGSIGQTGVEIDASVLLGYDNGTSATCMVSLHSPMPGYARIFGTDGWIAVLPRFHHPDQFVLHRRGADSETFTVPHVGGGYCHELTEVTECLRAGHTESSIMALADTLDGQRILEESLAQLGLSHAEAGDVL